ncbi:hypothetical protein AAHA92_25126 [Salvia divinorum]|uniref:Uncharacterized protein n=1 Tax=Salvia divinorum TaxID=28513 RepID=A0ABD1GCS8_SALDI
MAQQKESISQQSSIRRPSKSSSPSHRHRSTTPCSLSSCCCQPAPFCPFAVAAVMGLAAGSPETRLDSPVEWRFAELSEICCEELGSKRICVDTSCDSRVTADWSGVENC